MPGTPICYNNKIQIQLLAIPNWIHETICELVLLVYYIVEVATQQNQIRSKDVIFDNKALGCDKFIITTSEVVSRKFLIEICLSLVQIDRYNVLE